MTKIYKKFLDISSNVLASLASLASLAAAMPVAMVLIVNCHAVMRYFMSSTPSVVLTNPLL